MFMRIAIAIELFGDVGKVVWQLFLVW